MNNSAINIIRENWQDAVLVLAYAAMMAITFAEIVVLLELSAVQAIGFIAYDLIAVGGMVAMSRLEIFHDQR